MSYRKYPFVPFSYNIVILRCIQLITCTYSFCLDFYVIFPYEWYISGFPQFSSCYIAINILPSLFL